jgi:hypothetical protein
MTNYIIYVIYYDDHSKAEAERVYGNCSWARLVFNPTTKYLETGFILDLLPKLEEEWGDKEYVGTISWKAHTKTNISIETLNNAKKNNIDLIYLMYGDSNFEGFFNEIDIYHPFFTRIWRLIFKEYPDPFPKNIVPFYCNYWLTKPSIMKTYIEFANDIRDRIEKDVDIKLLIEKNAMWTQPPDTYKFVTGKKFYMYHPFIMERLPCFFAYIKNLKISHIKRLADLPIIKPIISSSKNLIIYVYTGNEVNFESFVNSNHSADCYYVMEKLATKEFPNMLLRSRTGIYEGWSDVILNIDKAAYDYYIFANDKNYVNLFSRDNWDDILINAIDSDNHFIQFDETNFIVDKLGLDVIYGNVFHPIIEQHDDKFAMDKTRKSIAKSGYYPEYVISDK